MSSLGKAYIELRDTERSYVQHLQILRDVFAVPLSRHFIDDVINANQTTSGAEQAILTKSEHASLFQYIDLIRPPHEVFLSLLSQRLPSTKDSSNGQQFDNVTVGDLVAAHLKALAAVPHYQQFMTSYPATQAAFASASLRKAFAEFLIVRKQFCSFIRFVFCIRRGRQLIICINRVKREKYILFTLSHITYLLTFCFFFFRALLFSRKLVFFP
jgi:hypothetical protein